MQNGATFRKCRQDLWVDSPSSDNVGLVPIALQPFYQFRQKSLSAANQNEWIKHIKARLAEKYPDIKLVAIQPSDGDRDRAFQETQNVLKVHPNVKLIMGVAAPAVPGAAEAVKQAGKTGK